MLNRNVVPVSNRPQKFLCSSRSSDSRAPTGACGSQTCGAFHERVRILVDFRKAVFSGHGIIHRVFGHDGHITCRYRFIVGANQVVVRISRHDRRAAVWQVATGTSVKVRLSSKRSLGWSPNGSRTPDRNSLSSTEASFLRTSEFAHDSQTLQRRFLPTRGEIRPNS